ncbi:lantibiotic dehydratase family protein [Gelidibacter sp. F2691]|nr:lantibiotic dehydratase family protein [Gelidibacter sp. F2691]
MKHEFSYSAFNKYVIRTPILPFSEVSDLSIEEIIKLCEQPLISEAIYISSPELHQEMRKLIEGVNVKNKEKLVYSLLKYLLRMSHRCTPFGLFCGTAVGDIGEENNIEVNDFKNHKRLTRLDMNFLCSLAQELENKSDVRNQLKYFPNTSIYRLGDHLRYIEYRYEKTIRHHFMVSIDYSEYIGRILDKAQLGATINDLVVLIIDSDISSVEASIFINQLIDSQVLISSISPSVTGEHYFSIIKNIINNNEIQNVLIKTEDILKKINTNTIGTGLKYYNELCETLVSINVDFDQKYLLQTDLITSFKKNVLSLDVLKDVEGVLSFLNKLMHFEENIKITNFKNNFYERYEDEEIPLILALDVETGVGYGFGNGEIFNISSLLDDLNLQDSQLNKNKNYREIKWTKKDSLLIKKIMYATENNEKVIKLKDSDVINFKEDWSNLSRTFSVFLNILEGDKKDAKIHVSHVGGASATSILGRFCHADKEMEDFVKEIMRFDQPSDEYISAEILHLPENRVGNILNRPILTDYEIPYLAKSTLPRNKQILIDDILISLRDNKIVLRSKSYNKEIVPRLSTAHDYTSNSLPIYHFLCDLQLQNLRESLSFDWGNLFSLFDFFPRVSYENVILSPAIWVIREDFIKELINGRNISAWRKQKNIPSRILLKDGDNELLINTKNELSVNMFISTIKNERHIIISEYLFNPKKSLVKNKEELFTNEIILSYYNKI